MNSASGTSFHILNGIPVFIDQEYSDGAFPIAVTEHNGTVYVLNARGSGAVVAFKADSLGGLHELQNSSTFLTSLLKVGVEQLFNFLEVGFKVASEGDCRVL